MMPVLGPGCSEVREHLGPDPATDLLWSSSGNQLSPKICAPGDWLARHMAPPPSLRLHGPTDVHAGRVAVRLRSLECAVCSSRTGRAQGGRLNVAYRHWTWGGCLGLALCRTLRLHRPPELEDDASATFGTRPTPNTHFMSSAHTPRSDGRLAHALSAKSKQYILHHATVTEDGPQPVRRDLEALRH